MPHAQVTKNTAPEDVAATAKLLVLLLAFAWGLNWIAAAIALREVPVWSLRFAGAGIGTITLFAVALLTGHSLKVPRGEHKHIMVAGFLNVAAFQILSAFAQTVGDTSRVVIVTYSMPIWSTLFAFILIGERLNGIRLLALGLCVAGLTTLVWPLFSNGFPPVVLLALGCALTWSFASVYIKWVKVTIEPLANAAWQLLFGFVFITIGTFIFDGYPRLWPIGTSALLAVLYVGVLGVGLAHFLWWSIVGKLPAVTASIGALLVPVVGVIASIVFLGEKPTINDMIGFVLIFCAAACVLLQPSARRTEMPE
jgi:drug/metabolite transporter (DMT)-like permease